MHATAIRPEDQSLRKAAGLTQGELAARAGISAPYLNLIEANKRAVAGTLVDRLAGGLGVDRASIDGEAERRVVHDLEEIAADPDIAARRPRGRRRSWSAATRAGPSSCSSSIAPIRTSARRCSRSRTV